MANKNDLFDLDIKVTTDGPKGDQNAPASDTWFCSAWTCPTVTCPPQEVK